VEGMNEDYDMDIDKGVISSQDLRDLVSQAPVSGMSPFPSPLHSASVLNLDSLSSPLPSPNPPLSQIFKEI